MSSSPSSRRRSDHFSPSASPRRIPVVASNSSGARNRSPSSDAKKVRSWVAVQVFIVRNRQAFGSGALVSP